MENSENQSVKDRLKAFIVFKNISTREFERRIDAAYGFIGNMSKSTSPEKIMRICNVFPELNPDWLLTGEGEMLRGQVLNVSGHHNKDTMKGDITHNYAPGTDLNLALMNEITEHRKIINKSQEQIDELIGIIRELAGKLKVES